MKVIFPFKMGGKKDSHVKGQNNESIRNNRIQSRMDIKIIVNRNVIKYQNTQRLNRLILLGYERLSEI